MKRLACVAVLVATAAAASPRFQRTITPGGKGPNRLDVDVALLAGAKARTLGNLRLRDAAGREVPYLLIAPPSRTPAWKKATILPIAATKKTSGFEADLGATTDVDRIEIDGVAAPFLKRLKLEGGGDRAHWTVLAGEATVFDLPDEKLRNVEVAFAPGEYRYLRVTWDDRASARVKSVGTVRARVHDSGSEPPPVTVPVGFRVLASEQGKSRYRLALPGPHLPVEAIELQVSNANVDRAATVSEPRLSGNSVAPVELGASTLRRAERDGAVAADTAIKISFPEGPDLDLAVENGSNPPLSIERIVARLAPQPWIYFESADGAPLTATYGDPSLAAPRYDLEASRRGIPATKTARASWSHAAAAVREASAGGGVSMGGAPVERKDFRYARTIGAIPRGLTSLVLDAHVLANSAALSDVRLTDAKGNQVPYLVERRDSPLAIRLAIPNRHKGEGSESIYGLALPFDSLPSAAQIVVRTDAHVFDRDIILRKPADESHGREAAALEVTNWRSSEPESDPPPLTLDAPTRDARALELVIDEGDNAPLRIVSAELLLPSYALRFVNPGSPLTLLYGNPSAPPPRYDLALLAPRLFGESSHEVTLAAGAPSDASGTTSRERKIFWIVIAAAAVVLLLTLTRLLSGVSAAAR
ncbi:MAG: DUF3999 family protein [Acidobacteriota bacterium]